MGAVLNLNPTESLSNQLDFFYGKETGWVHSPTLDRETNEWDEDKHFYWPRDKQKLIEHVEQNKKSKEVYIGPALYKTASNNVEDIKGSNVVWVDFDEGVPPTHQLTTLNIPYPARKIQSSVEGKQHWYWRFSQFNTDVEQIQGINRSLTYALEGDLGGWKANKVLRPVASINHKRGGIEVTLLEQKSFNYAPNLFEVIPVPVSSFDEDTFDVNMVPNPMNVLLEFSIQDVDLKELLLKREVKNRSAALMRIAYECAELGMDNSQVFSIVRWVDSREGWSKFRNRPNRDSCYIELINKARQKAPYKGIPEAAGAGLKTYGYLSMIAHTDDTKWLIDGLLPETGLMYIAAPSESGKTLLATEMCIRLAIGESIFNWKSETGEPLRILFLSLEMPKEELKQHWVDKLPNLSDVQQELLEKNFHTYAEPDLVRFYDLGDLQNLVTTIERIKPHIVLVDSATVALSKNLLDFEGVQSSLSRLYILRNKLKFAMIVIAHTRKNPPAHGLKEAALDDLFGSQAIAASASSVIGLRRDIEKKPELVIDVAYLKTRFKGDHSRMTIKFDSEKHTFIRPVYSALEAGNIGQAMAELPTKTTPVAKKSGSGNGSGFLPI